MFQMSTIQEIQKAVSQLSSKDLAHFREWFEEYDAQTWDKQFEQDARSGKLDKLANQAITDFHAGKHKKL